MPDVVLMVVSTLPSTFRVRLLTTSWLDERSYEFVPENRSRTCLGRSRNALATFRRNRPLVPCVFVFTRLFYVRMSSTVLASYR